jgi:hypothetical protein
VDWALEDPPEKKYDRQQKQKMQKANQFVGSKIHTDSFICTVLHVGRPVFAHQASPDIRTGQDAGIGLSQNLNRD